MPAAAVARRLQRTRRTSAARSPPHWSRATGFASDSRPCAITASRSQISNSSSSSSDTTSTATPLSRRSSSAWRICAAAPTSTPHVGCAAISSFGRCRISRPTMYFCRLPPDRLRAAACGPAALTPNVANRLASRNAHDARAPHEPVAHHALAMRGEQRIVGERHLGHGAAAEALLGHEREAERAPLRGIQRPDRHAAGCVIVPASCSGRSPDSAASSSCWPLPETPAMPTISPARTREVDSRRATCRTDRRPAA